MFIIYTLEAKSEIKWPNQKDMEGIACTCLVFNYNYALKKKKINPSIHRKEESINP